MSLADRPDTTNTILTESGDFMKKKIIVVLIFLLMFAMCSCDNSPETFSFDPQKHKIADDSSGGNRIIPQSIQEVENSVRFNDDGTPYTQGAIVICSISGESINRIIEPPDSEREPGVVYGINHVLTPIKIQKIIYCGEDTCIEEGKEYYLAEPYFLVTKGTPDYYEYFGDGCIIAGEYYPMTKGNTYLIYLTQESSEIYDYQGEPVLNANYLQEGTYCLGDLQSVKALHITEDPNYWKLWEEANALYGEYFRKYATPTK